MKKLTTEEMTALEGSGIHLDFDVGEFLEDLALFIAALIDLIDDHFDLVVSS